MSEFTRKAEQILVGTFVCGCLIVSVVMKCAKSSDEGPVVTSKEKVSEVGLVRNADGELVMQDSMYRLHDSNKICKDNFFGQHFSVIKSFGKILPTDKCENCGYTWKKHDDA